MFYVYLLKNEQNELYYGCTKNLKKRFFEHNDHRSFYTKTNKWKLVYYEAYLDEADAWEREKQLKQYGQALAQLKRRIKKLNEIVNNFVKRPEGSYAVWARDVQEADEKHKNKSANMAEKEKLDVETLGDRLAHELKYFDETGKHLDIDNVTLTGSRNPDGNVLNVNWNDGKMHVNWNNSDNRNDNRRSRQEVSKKKSRFHGISSIKFNFYCFKYFIQPLAIFESSCKSVSKSMYVFWLIILSSQTARKKFLRISIFILTELRKGNLLFFASSEAAMDKSSIFKIMFSIFTNTPKRSRLDIL